MRKGLLKKIGMILLMTIIVIGGVAVGSKKVKASEVEPRLLEETEHGNCGEPEAYRNWIGGVIYEEVYYSFKNGVLTIYGRSDTPKEHVFDVRFNKILNGYFENCTNIEKVVVNVDEIVFGENAFKGCTNLTTVTMPKVIHILSTSAFEGCEKLESIIFPDGCHLQNSGISENCFKNCTSLTSIELPSHCNQINTGVFDGCSSLETVVFEEIVFYSSRYSTPFNGCSNITTIVMKNKNSDLNDDNSINGIKKIISYAASASSNFSTIKVPHQYADAAREYIENQLVSDIERSLEKPIDVVAIYSVAFDNNGYDTAPDSILADGNKSITAPTPLADDTKCFAGWYKEATCENAWDFENDLVTEDITLYAKWNDNHNYADVTDSGIHKCVFCGKEESHDFTNQSYQPDDFGMHFKKCKYCEAETVHEAHYGGTATCKDKAICEACDEEYGSLDSGNHNISTTWSTDTNQHWHACLRCGEKLNTADHSYPEGDTCNICGQDRNHVHRLDESNWVKDGSSHWHECTGCTEKLEFASHTWDAGAVTKDPTVSEEGVKTYTCTVCEQTKEESIDKLQPDPAPEVNPGPENRPSPDNNDNNHDDDEDDDDHHSSESSSDSGSSSDNAESQPAVIVNQNTSNGNTVSSNAANTVPTYTPASQSVVAETVRANADGTVSSVAALADGTVRETTALPAVAMQLNIAGNINPAAPTVVSNVSLVVNRTGIAGNTNGVSSSINNAGLTANNSTVRNITAVIEATTVNGTISITPQMVSSLRGAAAAYTGKSLNTTNIDIKINTVAANGKPLSVIVSTEDLKNNATLKAYVMDPVTGGYIMVDVPSIKYDKKTGITTLGLVSGLEYHFVSAAEAKKIENSVVNSVKVSNEFAKTVAAAPGAVLDMSKAISSGFNMMNANKIEYSASGNQVTINPLTGQLIVNGNAKGTVTVSIKVTLRNGKTKTIKTKLKIG